MSVPNESVPTEMVDFEEFDDDGITPTGVRVPVKGAEDEPESAPLGQEDEFDTAEDDEPEQPGDGASDSARPADDEIEQLISTGKGYGLSEAFLKTLQPEQIQTLVNEQHQAWAKAFASPEQAAAPPVDPQQQAPPSAPGQQQVPPAPAAPPPQEGQFTVPQQLVDEYRAKLELNPEVWDEEGITVFQKLADQLAEQRHYADLIATNLSRLLDAENEKQTKSLQERNESLRKSHFEQVKKLGPEWHDVFGTDQSAAKPGTVEFENHGKLAKAVSGFMERLDVPFETAFQYALNGLFHDKVTKLNQDKISRKLDRAGSRATGRPSSSQRAKGPMTEEQAKEELEREFQEMGLDRRKRE